MPDYEYKHIVKIMGDEKTDIEIRKLLADGWELDGTLDSTKASWLAFDSSSLEKEIPAAKYVFRREKRI